MSTWGGNPSFDAFELPDEHEELRSVAPTRFNAS